VLYWQWHDFFSFWALQDIAHEEIWLAMCDVAVQVLVLELDGVSLFFASLGALLYWFCWLDLACFPL
jgi:hypothetical protein